MPIIRNPFRNRTIGGVEPQDENRPISQQRNGADRNGFQQTNVVGTKPVDIKEPAEYKLSEINDSGVYLPPSPPAEKKTFWQSRASVSRTSSDHRSALSENEPFSISRESFDSYRRSFDISARSPIPDLYSQPRQSLDSRRAFLPRSSLHQERIDKPYTPPDEGFEEVGLNDEVKPKKRGLFSRFGDSSDANGSAQADGKPANSHHGFHILGRKRGQSVVGAELANIEQAKSTQVPEVRVDT